MKLSTDILDVQAVWRRLARRLGGRYFLVQSEGARDHLQVSIKGVVVLADAQYEGIPGDEAQVRVRAAYAVPAGPRFAIVPEGLATRMIKLVQARDHELGDPMFDLKFVVDTPEPARTRAVVSVAVMEAMRRGFGYPQLHSDGRLVAFHSARIGADEKRLELALRLVAALAGTDVFGIDSLRRLEGARFSERRGAWNEPRYPHAMLPTRPAVYLGPAATDDRLPVTRAWAGCPRQSPWKAKIIGGTCDRPHIADAAQHLLARTGDGELRCEGNRVVFEWFTIEGAPDRLKAGAELVVAFARPAMGVYR